MKLLKKLLPIIGLLYFGWTTFGATRGVSFETTNTNVQQIVHQKFHSITNLASTAGEIALHNAEEKLVSTNAAGVRGMLSVPIFDSTDPGAVNIFPFWDDADNEVDWTSNTALRTLLGIDSNDAVTFGPVTGDSFTAGSTNVVGALAGKQPLDPDLTALAAIAGAQGAIIYHNGTSWVKLDPGTSGHVLKTQGAGANPQWAAESGGGGGSAPVGTVVGSGTSTQYALPFYSDATSTNIEPSLITTDATKTNLNVGGINANVVVITNLAQTLSNMGLGTEDAPNFTNVIVGTTNLSETLVATATSLATKMNLTGGNNIGGAQLLSEGSSIQLDAASSADGAFSGVTRTGTAGATLAFGDLIVLDATDSRWELADANSASGADGDSRGIIGICVQAAAGDGSATTVLLSGIVRADAAFPALTINGPIYVSETAGDITQTSPTTEDNVVRILGAAWTADEIHFAPDRVWTVYDAP